MTQSFALSRGQAAGMASFFVVLLAVAALNDMTAAEAAAQASNGLKHFGVFMSTFGLSGYMLIISALIVFAAVLGQRRGFDRALGVRLGLLAERASYFFVTIAVSGIAAQVIKHIVGRARPKLMPELGAYSFDPLSIKSSLASFPSGHATTVFAAAAALGFFMPRARLALIVFAVVIAIARVMAGAHYPSDVVAGALLGTVVALWLARVFADRNIAFHRVASMVRVKPNWNFGAAGSRLAGSVS